MISCQRSTGSWLHSLTSSNRAHDASTSSPSASGPSLWQKAERADPKQAGRGAHPPERFQLGMVGDFISESGAIEHRYGGRFRSEPSVIKKEFALSGSE